MAIACGEIETVVGTTFSATATETCASGENRVGVWYQITVNETSVISLQTCFKQTDFNTEISVFSGTCDNLNCVPEVGETDLIPSGVNCESSPGTNGTQGEFIADPGAYYIMVHGTSTAESGSFALSVTCDPILATSLTGLVTWNVDCGARDGEIELYETGTAILAGSQEVVISEGGTFSADFELLGSFDIYLKVDGFLAVSESTVVLDTNPMDILFDPLPPGDLSGSNTVGLPDFSSFSSAYGSGAGSPGFNVLADFNCDGAIDLQDFSIFSTNYGSSGAEP